MYIPKSKHEKYDKILREFDKPKEFSLVSNEQPADLHYLATKKYIELTIAEDGPIIFYGITDTGFEFINEGGFVEQGRVNYERDEYQKTLDAKNIKINTKMMWISGGSLVISAFVIIITIFSNQTTNVQMLKVNARLDSLNLESRRSSLNINQQKGSAKEPVKVTIIDTIIKTPIKQK